MTERLTAAQFRAETLTENSQCRSKYRAVGAYDQMARWEPPKPTLCQALPGGAIDMLWADELHSVCNRLCISVGKRPTRDECMRAIRWYARGSEITKEVCRALRQRKCAEADPPVEEIAA